MDLKNRSIALYGRFSAGQRERLRHEIVQHDGKVARDLTRRSGLLVIGALAVALIDCGALANRVKSAKARGVPVMGERAFVAALNGAVTKVPSTLPLANALASTSLTADDADILAAFDLIALQDDKISFADARTLRTAAEILDQNRSRADAVRILLQAEHAPIGRHKLVLMPSGNAALQWEHGLSTLEGQGLLPLEFELGGIDELFEAAQVKEASGDVDEASRLYDMCARAERSDAIALYNLGNIRLAQGAISEAILAYRRAVARDSDFVEARYNLALALESSGKLNEALEELARVLDLDPDYLDAIFNRAQLLMKAGEIAAAKELYVRYLALNPPDEWAATARKAIRYCSAHLSA
jgi:tetratricopeptide (TPR) repeat protein